MTRDAPRFVLHFWETQANDSSWEFFIDAPGATGFHEGRDALVRWEGGAGALAELGHNFNPSEVRGRSGVVVGKSSLLATLYEGEMFGHAGVPVLPKSDELLPAIWAFLSSEEFRSLVRLVNPKVVVDSGYLLKVPFDVECWRGVAAERYPDGLPEPWSDDPTQWLFEGDPAVAKEPLQVAVARLMGYRWL